MKKALLFTLYGNHNYGNKLQNFAVQTIMKSYGVETYTVVHKKIKNTNIIVLIKKIIKIFIPKYIKKRKKEKIRVNNFKNFDKYIHKIKYNEIVSNNYDYIIVGSDQVWNPNDALSQQLVESINNYENKNIISFAASIAVDHIQKEFVDKYKKQFNIVNSLSVREVKGKEIIKYLTSRNDVEVILDPTMLLSVNEWEKIMKKPKTLGKKRFILNYFLGNLSDDKYNEIKNVANKYDCEIINLLDENSPFYFCDPAEFLYLEKNAFLICTDSFHSSVFAILYNRPFVIFDREQKGMDKMNSRLDTLINKFNLKNRKFDGKITEENLNHDYSDAYVILEEERKKSKEFLVKALDIKK